MGSTALTPVLIFQETYNERIEYSRKLNKIYMAEQTVTFEKCKTTLWFYTYTARAAWLRKPGIITLFFPIAM